MGDLRGGTTRYLRREDEERQAARSAAQWVALGLTDLAGAAQSIKAEIVSEWASFVQREQIGIPEPSEQLQAVLAEGPMTQAALAEVARNNDLMREINIFLDAAHQRFGWAGMSSIREGRVDVLRSRMAGIKEHDLERAATLTRNMLMLHDKVHDSPGYELKREVEQADARAKVGPMDADRAIGIGAFMTAGTILAAFAVFGLTLNTTPSYPRGLWRQVGGG